MSLSADLESGACGVRWAGPADGERIEDGRQQVTWRASAGGLLQVTRSPFPFGLGDVGAALDPTLRADLEASCRAAFVAHHARRGEVPDGRFGGRRGPRTDDPAWSPIIELDLVRLPGGPAARLIRRRSYASGDEVVTGHLLVPTADGHVELAVLASAEVTGMRESVTLAIEGVRSAAELPTQDRHDRRELDASVPDHPVSVVRRQLDLLAGGGVEVLRPAAPAPRETLLPQAGCAIAAPPRFLPVAAGVLPLSPTMGTFVRPGLDGWMRMFEVWQAGRVHGRDRPGALAAAARHALESWAKEGVTDLRVLAGVLPDLDGRPQLAQDVEFVVGGPKRGHFRWFVDHDGVMFRVGTTADAAVAADDLRADVAAAIPTWRRLDPVSRPAPPPPPSRPWWKRW